MAEPRDLAASHQMRVRRAKQRRRMLINAAVAVVVIIGILALIAARRDRPTTIPGLVTGTVTRGDIVQEVSATGSVTAQTGAMVKIGSQITGRIKYLYADVGGHVKAGQVIAELDVPDLRAQVAQAEATLSLNQKRLNEQLAGVELQRTQASTDIQRADAAVAAAQADLAQAQQTADLQVKTAQAQVRSAQANSVNAAANLKRQEELYQKGYVAASDVDDARAQQEVNAAQLASAQQNLAVVQTKVRTDITSTQQTLAQAQAAAQAARAGTAQNAVKEAQVAEAREAVRQSTAQVALARANLDKAYIRTPISGTVLQLAQQEGETIAAGLSAPTVIIVADLSRLQVDAYVDETDIGKVRLGQPAEVTVDAYPDHVFRGKVAKIASGSTMQQNVVTYDVTVAMEKTNGQLKPDMTATTNIRVAERRNALTVPIDAVKPSAHGNTVTVMTQGPQGKPQFQVVPVKTGISDGEKTEILSGLKEGDTVVLAGEVPGMSQSQGGPHFRGPFFGGGRRGSSNRSGGGGGRGRG